VLDQRMTDDGDGLHGVSSWLCDVDAAAAPAQWARRPGCILGGL